jgi:hypothetical protein
MQLPQQALRNIGFSKLFTYLLNQPLKDTLCGTKVLCRAHYERLAANRAYFGDFDPFGDFDLIFGAAKLNLKILEIPIRYRDRTYGETNIHRPIRSSFCASSSSWRKFASAGGHPRRTDPAAAATPRRRPDPGRPKI